MANKRYFTVGDGELLYYREKEIEYEYVRDVKSETAVFDKKFDSRVRHEIMQKNVESLHKAIKKNNPTARILEISTKSADELGRALSAFNLKWKTKDRDYYVESLYQGSKVFQNSNGKPYKDIFFKEPREAKGDPRLKTSGNIQGYEFQGRWWELIPEEAFYDWLYIKSLLKNPDLCEALDGYDTFTDIEFGPNSLNCQARSVALYVTLKKCGKLDLINDPDSFKAKVYAVKEGRLF